MTESNETPTEDRVGRQPGSEDQAADRTGDEGRSIPITFNHPDVIFEIHPQLLDTWGEDPFLAIKNVGFFLRVVMPVRLDDGSRVDFGTWLEIHAEAFRTAWQTWNAPEYSDLSVQGYVANDIAPWGKFPHVLVKASVGNVDEVPALSSCEDPQVMRIIEEAWPRDYVLSPYADVLSDGPTKAGSNRRNSGKRGKGKSRSGPPPEAV